VSSVTSTNPSNPPATHNIIRPRRSCRRERGHDAGSAASSTCPVLFPSNNQRDRFAKEARDDVYLAPVILNGVKNLALGNPRSFVPQDD